MSTQGSAPEAAAQASNTPAGRPRKAYTTGAVTTWLRRGSILITLGSALTLIVTYGSLPDEIPIHFNLGGTADGWGPKSSVFSLVGIFGAIVLGSAWLSTNPHLLNYPADVTEDNAQRMYREGERLLVWLAFAIALLTVSFALSTLLAVELGFFITFMVAVLLGLSGVGVVRIINAGRWQPAP